MPARILLVDDDRFARQVYGDSLLASGFDVDAAASGEEALERLRQSTFDVVVTDMLLPGLDGLGVLEGARKLDPHLGVVVITALDVVDPAVKAIKAGAFDYLVKPVAPAELERSVRRCMEFRSVLLENTDLQRHLALLQAVSRISGARGRDEICRETAGAVALHTGAGLVAIVEHPDGAPARVRSLTGSRIPAPPGLLAEVDTWLERGAARPEASRPDGTPVTRVVVPGGPVTALVLYEEPTVVSSEDLRGAQFLIQSASRALEGHARLEQAENLAFIDDLTQLFNGRYLARALQKQVQAAERFGTPFSVLFLDLDRFKEVNDTHGHLVGSELLVEVSRVIRGAIRESDVAVRYGGDEYVVVLPDTGPEGAMNVAERIRARIEGQAFLAREQRRLRVTACVGVASYPDHATAAESLLELADRAMYQGKRGARNVVYLADVGASG